MKKTLCLLLAVIMAFGMLFCGCGKDSKESADEDSETFVVEDPIYGTVKAKKPANSDYTIESISDSTGASAEYYIKSKEQNFKADVYFISVGNTYEEYVADKQSLQAQGQAFNVKEYDLGEYNCAVYTQLESAISVSLQVYLKEPANGENGTVLYMYLEPLEASESGTDLLGVVDSNQFQNLLKGIRYDESLKPEAKQSSTDESADTSADETSADAASDTSTDASASASAGETASQ